MCCSARGEDMLLCDWPEWPNCRHLGCLNPVLHAVPEGDWFCPQCADKVFILNENTSENDYKEWLQRNNLPNHLLKTVGSFFGEGDSRQWFDGRFVMPAFLDYQRHLQSMTFREDRVMCGILTLNCHTGFLGLTAPHSLLTLITRTPYYRLIILLRETDIVLMYL